MSNYDASIRVHTEIDNSDIKRAEKEVERLAKKLDSVRKRSAKIETLGGSAKQLESLGYDAEMLENQLAEATERLEQLRTGGFVKAEKSAKKLGTTMKVLRNIVLSMVAFQVMAKGAEYIAEGFNNLSQYSTELNGVLSELKSETATLKNSIATAFEPIVTTIVPALSTLVSWLNSATNAIAQFWAYLGGKSTYTKAKKQVVDYAKSVKDASKSAKGALAAFDEINVLNKSETSSAGGEITGTDAFEEAEVDKTKFAWVEWLKENLDEILSIVGFIGAGFLAWKLMPAIPSFISTLAGIAMIAAGAVALVAGAFDAWNNGVDWGSLSAMLIGATLLIGGLALAFGPLAAGIASAITGLAFLWIGINDIMENGLNLKNALLSIAGVFLMVSSVAGAAVGAIAAVIAGLVLAIANDWEDFKATVWEPMKVWGNELYESFNQLVGGIKTILEGFSKFFMGVLTGDFESALKGAQEIFEGAVEAMDGIGRGFMNVIIGLLNTVLNVIEGAINAVFDVINSLDFTVPDWVPIIGGKQFGGFNLQPVSWDDIPYLATGGTVTAATLANLGEGNKKEVVLPLEQNTEWADIIADKITSRTGSGKPTTVVIEIDGKEVARTTLPYMDAESARVGTKLVTT